MNNKKELSVSAIKDGTVIDHIPADALFQVISILNLNQCSNQISFGTNLESRRRGKKAIIKVADTFFEETELNKIAFVAPDARLNVIRDYEVVEKREVFLPQDIVGIAKCFNPKCITNNELVTTKFSLVDSDYLAIRCFYCEKITVKEHIEFI